MLILWEIESRLELSSLSFNPKIQLYALVRSYADPNQLPGVNPRARCMQTQFGRLD